MTEPKKYIVDADTISAFEDYFLALYSGDGNKTRLLQLWQSNMSVARSEPLGPTLYTAGMVKNRVEHERQRVLDVLLQEFKGRYVEDAIAEIRRFNPEVKSARR